MDEIQLTKSKVMKISNIPNIKSLGNNKICIGGKVYYVDSVEITSDISSNLTYIGLEAVYLERYISEDTIIDKVRKDKKSRGGFYKLMENKKEKN